MYPLDDPAPPPEIPTRRRLRRRLPTTTAPPRRDHAAAPAATAAISGARRVELAEEHLGDAVEHRRSTARVAATARASGTRTISLPASATIWPNAPSCTASMAAMPKRVDSTRSKAVGVPPRWTWPRIVTRVSKPVRSSISSASDVADAARAGRGRTGRPRLTRAAERALLRHGPLGHHDDRRVPAPARGGGVSAAHTSSMSKGSSGMRITRGAAGDAGVGGDVAGVAAHDLAHHHPVVRLGRGVQPVDGVGGDLHGGVEAERDLGGRRGRCRSSWARRRRRRPRPCELVGHAEGVLAADGDERVDLDARRGSPCTARRRRRPCTGSSATCRGSVPPRGSVPRMRSTSSGIVPVLDDAPPAVAEADELVAVVALALAHDGPDHGVQARAVAAAGEHSDPHLRHVTRAGTPSGCTADRADDAADGRRRSHRRRDHRRARRSPSTSRAGHRRLVATASSPSTSPSPGWVEHDAAEIWDAVQATLAELVGRARPADRRHRHHRPARDGGGVGPPHGRAAAPGHRLAGPAHRRRCDELARRRPPRPRARRTTGLVLDPYFSATKLEWLLHRGRRRRRRRPRLRHRRPLGALEPDRRRRRTPPTRPTPAARCCSTSDALAWSPSCATLFGVPAVVPARGAPVERARSASTAARRRRARRHPDQRHRRRPAGGAVRPGLLRAGHDEEHLRHRLVRAHERRRRRARRRSRAAHHGRLAARPTATTDVRPRGRDLRHRRRHPVAARRARASSPTAAEIGPLAASCRRHRTACTSCPPSPAWAARGGTRTPGARSSASPAAPAGPTWPGPSSRPWRTRPATWSRPWSARVGPAVADAAGRRRRLGDGPAAAAPGRPARRARGRARRCRRPRPSAPPTWPAWPRASGARSTTSQRTWQLDAEFDPERRPPPLPTPPTRAGCAPSSAPAPGPLSTPAAPPPASCFSNRPPLAGYSREKACRGRVSGAACQRVSAMRASAASCAALPAPKRTAPAADARARARGRQRRPRHVVGPARAGGDRRRRLAALDERDEPRRASAEPPTA